MTAYAVFSIVPLSVMSPNVRQSAVDAAAAAKRDGRDACLASTVTNEGTSSTVLVRFDGDGCEIAGHRVRGETTYRFTYANGCGEVEADLGGLIVDGAPVVAVGGYRRCLDEQRVWLRTEASVGDHGAERFTLEATLGLDDGVPIVGSTVVHLDALGAVEGMHGSDRVRIEGLRYEVGEFLPSDGSIHVETADGHDYRASFRDAAWRFGTAEVAIDGMAPVTIPIVH